jgi:hypothetical protein
MMTIIKRLIFILSLAILYIIFKELLELYMAAKSLHPIAGYILLIGILGFITYFIGIPIFKIIRMPRFYGPTKNKDEIPSIIKQRIDNFRNNNYLINRGFDFNSITYSEETYKKIIDELQTESQRIRKKYVSQLFYSSSISQNGFLDAILILSSSINLVKEIFILYNGRVSNRDILTIGKKVYYSMAIGGSEGIEYATEEIISKVTSEGVKSIPFIDKVMGSIADGFVNALLLTRISLITENYCNLIYIESDRSLLPSPTFILETTKNVTVDVVDKVKDILKKMAADKFEKSVDYAKYALNPAGYVLKQCSQSIQKASTKTVYATTEAVNWVGSGTAQILSLFKKKKSSPEKIVE